MSDPSILALFEGLTPAEARTFRTRLLGAAQAIRSEVRPEPKRETQTERQAGMSKVPAELQKVQDAISDTEAKLAALKQTEKEATATVKEMEATLAAEVLDGSRIDESARVLTRERARLGASGNAKAQLESKLEALKQDKARLDYEAACGAYEGHAREVRRQLVHCFELLYDVVAGDAPFFLPAQGLHTERRVPPRAEHGGAAGRAGPVPRLSRVRAPRAQFDAGGGSGGAETQAGKGGGQWKLKARAQSIASPRKKARAPMRA